MVDEDGFRARGTGVGSEREGGGGREGMERGAVERGMRGEGAEVGGVAASSWLGEGLAARTDASRWRTKTFCVGEGRFNFWVESTQERGTHGPWLP